MNAQLRAKYGQDLTTQEPPETLEEFKRRLAHFYETHNKERTVPSKLNALAQKYIDNQDQVLCPPAARPPGTTARAP